MEMYIKHIVLLFHPSSLKSVPICSGVGNWLFRSLGSLLTIRYCPTPIGVAEFLRAYSTMMRPLFFIAFLDRHPDSTSFSNSLSHRASPLLFPFLLFLRLYRFQFRFKFFDSGKNAFKVLWKRPDQLRFPLCYADRFFQIP